MAQVIEVTTPQAPPVQPNPNIMDVVLDFVAHYWWVFLIIIVLLGVVLYVIWKIVEKLEEGKFPIIKLYKERKRICKQHRDISRFRSFMSPEKNHKVVCQFIDNGNLKRTVVGHYYGDYYSSEGNRVIAYFKKGQRKWLIFPVIRLLLINKLPKTVVKIKEKDKKTNKIIEEEREIKLPTNIDYFTGDEVVLMGCKSIDKLDDEGFFNAPVLADEKGNQIDFSPFAYEQIINVMKGEQLITNLNYFVEANRKALDINPMLRAEIKTKDSSGTVESSHND